jgi:carbamoyltransferase
VPVISVEHHLAHLASAFFCSPFEEAALLSVDGFGDFVSTMLAVGRGNEIVPLSRVYFPHSLGIFYTALTQYLGFDGFGDEYKVMGLAAYGKPSFKRELEQLVPARSDGTFCLNLKYFLHLSKGVEMTWNDEMPRLGQLFSPKLEELLGPARRPDQPIGEREQDIAASLQAVYEERFFSLVRSLLAQTGLKRLCLAGGCALNSVANGKLFDQTPAETVFIQPAAGDGGTSLGAALYVHHHYFGKVRSGFVMEHAAWGPEHGEEAVRRALGASFPEIEGRSGRFFRQGETFELVWFEDEGQLVEETAAAVARGEVVGWFQGRSEWGPRALGQRSILADPRRPDMKTILNQKIKRRESFRPFAPSILEERVGEWFERDVPDPFMLKVYPIRPAKRPLIPAVTHVDGTGRLQTVSKRALPLYYRLIRAFEARTGVPMVLNTSFNENEPIVNRPEEALDCFLRTGMDCLVLGRAVLRRRRPEG